MVNMKEAATYDEMYMTMWEISQRYSTFTNFRVIGNSHDHRMIPMLEIGHGEKVLFCMSGICGEEMLCCQLMIKMLKEYCLYYERNWELQDLYKVRQLLDKVRICMIPVINPDGYEIVRNGYLSIRNPVMRQMLRMQDIPSKEYEGNGRNTKLYKDFPLLEEYFENTGEELYSEDELCYEKNHDIENETRALIKIFKEYQAVGLIMFGRAGGKIVQYRYSSHLSFSGNGRDRRIASQIKRLMGYRLETKRNTSSQRWEKDALKGDCGQYFAKFIRKPAFRIDIPDSNITDITEQEDLLKGYESVKTIPLEFIFSI